MVAVLSHPPPVALLEVALPPDEQRLLLHGVSWDEYCRISEQFDDRPAIHLTYLCGELEIMTVGRAHEALKTRIARLVEAWSEEFGIDLRGEGSTTFRRKAKERGLEPDECYTLAERPRVPGPQEIDRPDLAIEVVVTSPLVDKLAVYAGLEVPEVWVWRANAFEVFVLDEEGYRPSERSVLLPEIDLAMIAELALEPKQIDAVRALRARCAVR